MPSPSDVSVLETSGASNADVARILDRVSSLLLAQGASIHRVRAWAAAAQSVRTLDRDLRDLIAEGGTAELDRIPAVGPSLAAAIEEIVRTGRLRFLAHLEGTIGPDAVFTAIPGVGPALARRIAETLDVHTLEELEIAAHDGRLARVTGIGPRRVRAIRDSIAALERSLRPRRRVDAREAPSVAQLLDVDDEYRRREASLPHIAPRRFNPKHEAWLPVLHTTRDDWHFTALYSNTARAHSLGTTHDWVVVYAERDGREIQSTVVTETGGPRRGQRVVRGREAETPPRA